MQIKQHLNRIRWQLQSSFVSTRTLDLDGKSVTVGARSATEIQRIHGFQRDEWPLLRGLVSRIEPDDVLWDVGANIGFYSLFGGHCCRVAGFEANPADADRLRRNILRNDLAAVDALGVALADKNGMIEFDTDVATIKTGQSISSIYIPALTGDWVIENSDVPSPTVLKVDVEGAEKAVLDGLKGALPGIKLILIEYHTPESNSPATDPALLDQLERSGFELREAESESKSERHYWAVRR